MHETHDEPAPARGPLRWLLLALGFTFTALGTLGAFLPVLPTTPFLLLAGACFVRSSPRFHRRLLANRAFGPYLAQWERDRTIPPEAKRKAYGLVVVTFAISITFFAEGWALRGGLATLGLCLLGFLALLPSTRERPANAAPSGNGRGEETRQPDGLRAGAGPRPR